ncbi:MAG: transglycosylase domain-containing protein [Clostridia bacterium]|nr:transglycosylase domain-containing protein [Clostridia bacterium]
MKIIRNIIIVILVLIISVVGYIVYQGYDMYKEAIDKISIEEKIEEIKSKENYTTLKEMPDMYKDAVISAEDHRFYKHGPIDVKSIGRAVLTNIKQGKLVEGGSTITQQLAKNTYFTQEKRFTRKVAEVFVAYQYEEKCEKDEILELYLNTSYFGDGCYSVKEASTNYFDKDPIDMTEYECIMLAGIPNAPSVYAPTKNPELAAQRARQVINKMVENGYLTKEEANKIIEENQNNR